MKYHGTNNAFLHLVTLQANQGGSLLAEPLENGLVLVWNHEAEASFLVNNEPITLKKNEIAFFTSLHKVETTYFESISVVRFNKNFYCILDHDHEVSCSGLLFFSPLKVPIIALPETEITKFTMLWRVFENELETSDKLQFEMLQMLLKRLIILCTRLYKRQQTIESIPESSVYLVRRYLFLVELNFKRAHNVAFYAELLNRSSKTLSNLFAKINQPSPQAIIHQRLHQEAQRLILHSNLSLKEIAFDLGFEEISTFSRFFKNQEGCAPTEFKEKSTL